MNCNLQEFVWIWCSMQGLTVPLHHRKMCYFLEKCWRGEKRKALLMAFRSSGKSTLVGLFCAWVLLVKAATRILIVSADYELAKKMVRNVKRIIEHHPLTKSLRPKHKDQWASDRFTVVRPLELRDPSVLAQGLSGNITGCRADLIVCDDVEVPKTCDTARKREDLRQKLTELDFVLTPDGMMLFVGTPHTDDSIYNTEPDGFLAYFEKLVIPLLNAEGQSAWPARFSLQAIEQLKKRTGPLKFLSQMLLQPVDLTESRLNIAHLQKYTDELVYHEANGIAELLLNQTKLVSATAWWDPAFGKKEQGDNSVFACLFADACGHYFLHDVHYIRIDNTQESAREQCSIVVALLKLYHLPVLYIETNGIGKFLPELLRQEIARQGVRCSVFEKSATAKKSLRIIDAFDAVLANRALYVHQRVFDTPFIQEMKDWHPAGSMHDDGLDAVAGCLLAEPVRLPKTQAARVHKVADWRFGKAHILSLDDVKL